MVVLRGDPVVMEERGLGCVRERWCPGGSLWRWRGCVGGAVVTRSGALGCVRERRCRELGLGCVREWWCPGGSLW